MAANFYILGAPVVLYYWTQIIKQWRIQDFSTEAVNVRCLPKLWVNFLPQYLMTGMGYIFIWCKNSMKNFLISVLESVVDCVLWKRGGGEQFLGIWGKENDLNLRNPGSMTRNFLDFIIFAEKSTNFTRNPGILSPNLFTMNP